MNKKEYADKCRQITGLLEELYYFAEESKDSDVGSEDEREAWFSSFQELYDEVEHRFDELQGHGFGFPS